MKNKLNLMSRLLVALVMSIFSLFPAKKAQSQSLPLDTNMQGRKSFILNEKAYKMSSLNDNLSAAGNIWDASDPYNAFSNPAAFRRTPDNEEGGGPFGLGVKTSPTGNALNQFSAVFVIPMSQLFANSDPDSFRLFNSKTVFYGGIMLANAQTMFLVPTDYPLPPGGNITSAPVDHYATIGATFNSAFHNDKLSVAVGLAYINSNRLNGSYNGDVWNHGSALAINLSTVYDLRDQYDGGWILGGGLQNLGLWKINYTNTTINTPISYSVPSRLYGGGSYNFNMDSGDKLSLAGELGMGMFTLNGNLTGSISARYSYVFDEDNHSALRFNLGYTQGDFFRGPMAGLGLKAGYFGINLGYCFTDEAHFGFNRFQLGFTIFNF